MRQQMMQNYLDNGEQGLYVDTGYRTHFTMAQFMGQNGEMIWTSPHPTKCYVNVSSAFFTLIASGVGWDYHMPERRYRRNQDKKDLTSSDLR
jgi:hypothetical protein